MWEQGLRSWARGRAYEKLALAETLLAYLTSEEKRPATGYEWKPGTDDLSRVSGRANWVIGRLLGIDLPNVLPTSSRQDLVALHGETARLLEAYRNGLIALAADHAMSPQKVAELKRRYAGRIVHLGPGDAIEYTRALDELLGEWPPIGRQMEGLISIIGAKGETSVDSKAAVLEYRFRFIGDTVGCQFLFVVKDGIIRSVLVTF